MDIHQSLLLSWYVTVLEITMCKIIPDSEPKPVATDALALSVENKYLESGRLVSIANVNSALAKDASKANVARQTS